MGSIENTISKMKMLGYKIYDSNDFVIICSKPGCETKLCYFPEFNTYYPKDIIGHELNEHFAIVTCLERDKHGIVFSSIPKIFVKGSDKNKLASYKKIAIVPCIPDYKKSKVMLLMRTNNTSSLSDKKYLLLNYRGKIVKLPESIFSMTLRMDGSGYDRYRVDIIGSANRLRGFYEFDSDLTKTKEKFI